MSSLACDGCSRPGLVPMSLRLPALSALYYRECFHNNIRCLDSSDRTCDAGRVDSLKGDTECGSM